MPARKRKSKASPKAPPSGPLVAPWATQPWYRWACYHRVDEPAVAPNTEIAVVNGQRQVVSAHTGRPAVTREYWAMRVPGGVVLDPGGFVPE